MADRELLARIAALEAIVGIGRPDADEAPPAHDVRLSKSATAKRYAVSPKTIERMVSNPTLGFPHPDIINGRWWFWLSHLQAFDRQRARLQVRPQQPSQLRSFQGRTRKAAAT